MLRRKTALRDPVTIFLDGEAVDGEPNVMTCLRRARGGERIETQNVVGSRKADLLRVTDWFFPNGLDHHHFMAGVPGLRDEGLLGIHGGATRP